MQLAARLAEPAACCRARDDRSKTPSGAQELPRTWRRTSSTARDARELTEVGELFELTRREREIGKPFVEPCALPQIPRKGNTASGGIIAFAASGLVSMCVVQNGHLSVATVSSNTTTAPHPGHRDSENRPVVCFPLPLLTAQVFEVVLFFDLRVGPLLDLLLEPAVRALEATGRRGRSRPSHHTSGREQRPVGGCLRRPRAPCRSAGRNFRHRSPRAPDGRPRITPGPRSASPRAQAAAVERGRDLFAPDSMEIGIDPLAVSARLTSAAAAGQPRTARCNSGTCPAATQFAMPGFHTSVSRVICPVRGLAPPVRPMSNGPAGWPR